MCLSLNGNFVSTLQTLTEKMLKGKNYNSQFYLKLSLLYIYATKKIISFGGTKKIHLVYLPSDLYYPYSEKQHPYLLFF